MPVNDLKFAELLAAETLTAGNKNHAVDRAYLWMAATLETGHLPDQGDMSSDDLVSGILPLGIRHTMAVDEVFAKL